MTSTEEGMIISVKGRLSKLKQVIEKQGFDVYNEEERGDFTSIEAREL